MTKPRTMAEVRAECAALGIQPGRSVAECERRIAAAKDPTGLAAFAKATKGENTRLAEQVADEIIACAAPGGETHPKFAEMHRTARRQRPMSRTMRNLADCTALTGTLAMNQLVYHGRFSDLPFPGSTDVWAGDTEMPRLTLYGSAAEVMRDAARLGILSIGAHRPPRGWRLLEGRWEQVGVPYRPGV